MTFKSLEFRPVYGGAALPRAKEEFLIPALQLAKSYDRVAGYFTSTVFAPLAPGIGPFVRRGGKIRLVTSHVLSAKDITALEKLDSNDLDFVSEIYEEFKNALQGESDFESQLRANSVKAMCWLIKNGLLEIRIVVPESPETPFNVDFEKFHPKFGLLLDAEGNQLVFAGSVNETLLGWGGNVESLSIYKGWVPDLASYCIHYEGDFNNYWLGENLIGWKSIPLPKALELKLGDLSQEVDYPDYDEWLEHTRKPAEQSKPEQTRSPRKYQLEARDAWTANSMKGILQMATGTGKTFTARLCYAEAAKLGSLFTIVVAPYQHIADQWVSELSEQAPIQLGNLSNWRAELQGMILNSQIGIYDTLTLVVVKNTASSVDFVKLAGQIASNFDHCLLIGDEVHWLGAHTFQNALVEFADFRLGLSATPTRYFDEDGTSELFKYFGGEYIYKFGLKEALEWPNDDGSLGVLAPYEYHPIIVDLSDSEKDEYKKISRNLAILQSDPDKASRAAEIERMRIKRAMIVKTAQSKINALGILLKNGKLHPTQTLIYCADNSQMELAMTETRAKGIESYSKITSSEGSQGSTDFGGLSEREHILSKFAHGDIGLLFAIACLDEGVDIPTATTGIILASSGNPKEFIQRRGRLMRKSPSTGKEKAVIYDFVVLGDDGDGMDGLRQKELQRIHEFSGLALNREEIEKLLEQMGWKGSGSDEQFV